MSNHSNPRTNDDEIDLIPLIQSLWKSKITLVATTLIGAVAALGLYATSPEQWTASTYITKPSLYSLYKEVKEKDALAATKPLPQEAKLYSGMQNDVFFTAMGVMTANSIVLKETTFKPDKNVTILYIASSTATSATQAAAQLKSAMDKANTDSLALNLPTLAPGNTLRAFNTLDEIKIITTKSAKKYAFLGALLGLILGSAFVLGRFFIRQYKHSNRE